MINPRFALVVSIVLAFAACAPSPAGQGSQGSGGQQAASSGAPKRLVAAIMAEPPALHRALIPPGYIIQTGDVVDTIVNIGLTIVDSNGTRQPVLAESVPTVENGLWRMMPDGQMQITWKIKPGAVWHDGTPFTAEDLVFTAQVARDPELPEFRSSTGLEPLDTVEAFDSSTITSTWRRPYIRAERLFSTGADTVAPPLPRHLLERTYQENKDGFRQVPYWSVDYVGAGPYKLKEWVAGSHLTLEANDRFALGKPKIDELEIRFILDANAVVANVLSGAVGATIGTGLNLEQTIEVRDQWRDGKMLVVTDAYVFAAPQFINPNPVVVTDLRFRRALLTAVDRQALADVIQSGLVPIAHNYVRPEEPEAKDTDAAVVRYDFDPRRAGQMIEEIGYVKGSDGTFQDASGQPLSLEVRATASPAIHTKTMFPVADYWQRLGIAIEQVVIPVQRLTDFEYRTTHPAFEVVRYRSGAGRVEQLHGSQTPLPQNRFSGGNRPRYMNPEWDGLIDTYLATIPWEPRMRALGQVVHHMTDQLNVMIMVYDVAPVLISNRIRNVASQNPTWNIHQWELGS